MQGRVISMDITVFIEWFFDQVISIFAWCYKILDNIKFSGTSLLKVIIFISIMIPLLGVLLTVGKNGSVTSSRSGRVKNKKEGTKESEE